MASTFCTIHTNSVKAYIVVSTDISPDTNPEHHAMARVLTNATKSHICGKLCLGSFYAKSAYCNTSNAVFSAQ